MSDPVFLRNMISNTVYAEQINSAQIQGHQAAKERAARALQEANREQAMSIKALQDSAEIGVRDEHGRGRQHPDQPPEGEEEEADDPSSAYTLSGEEAPKEMQVSGLNSIDVTI